MTATAHKSLADRVAAKLGVGEAGASPAAAPRRRPDIVGWHAAKLGESVMLMPGELYIGAEAASVKTLLGSCVALTLWHPKRRLGGMCHYLLPNRTRAPHDKADGRYGEEAVLAMVQQLEQLGCRTTDFTAHLYGGADTMAEGSGVKLNVGERNIERGWQLIEQFGFTLEGVDVGDNVPRTVTLELIAGQVECRRGNPH